mgnify:CR=1 FL=1
MHSLIKASQLAVDQLGLGLMARTRFPGRWVFAGPWTLARLKTGIAYDPIVGQA